MGGDDGKAGTPWVSGIEFWAAYCAREVCAHANGPVRLVKVCDLDRAKAAQQVAEELGSKRRWIWKRCWETRRSRPSGCFAGRTDGRS